MKMVDGMARSKSLPRNRSLVLQPPALLTSLTPALPSLKHFSSQCRTSTQSQVLMISTNTKTDIHSPESRFLLNPNGHRRTICAEKLASLISQVVLFCQRLCTVAVGCGIYRRVCSCAGEVGLKISGTYCSIIVLTGTFCT